jgi:hypothetical protein
VNELCGWLFGFHFSFFEICGAAFSLSALVDGDYISAVLIVLATAVVQGLMDGRWP